MSTYFAFAVLIFLVSSCFLIVKNFYSCGVTVLKLCNEYNLPVLSNINQDFVTLNSFQGHPVRAKPLESQFWTGPEPYFVFVLELLSSVRCMKGVSLI